MAGRRLAFRKVSSKGARRLQASPGPGGASRAPAAPASAFAAARPQAERPDASATVAPEPPDAPGSTDLDDAKVSTASVLLCHLASQMVGANMRTLGQHRCVSRMFGSCRVTLCWP